MNKHIFKLFFISLFSTFMLSSCLKDDLNSPNVPQAGFTMINVHSASDFIIHRADNNLIQTMNNPLRFKGINFVYLYPGNRKIQTIDADNKIIVDSTYSIKDSLLYTSFVYTKALNKVGQRMIEDALLPNLETNSAFRFLNLAHDKINVDLFIGDTQTLDNRAYDGETFVANNYKFTSNATGNKRITVKNQAGQVLAEKEVDMKVRMHYSIVLIKNTTNNDYEILVYEQYRS